MKHLVAYVASDRLNKKDASGAFIPESRAYCDRWRVDVDTIYALNCKVMQGGPARRAHFDAFCDSLADTMDEKCDVFAYFGHGTYFNVQLGYQRQHVDELAASLQKVLKPRCKVILYACSTAENDTKDKDVEEIGTATSGGFADRLRTAMMELGMVPEVFGHKTPGHVTWNPFWCRFAPDCASVGGDWVVRPRSEHWKAWVDAMRHTGLKYDFPWFTRAGLAEKLAAHERVTDACKGHDS